MSSQLHPLDVNMQPMHQHVQSKQSQSQKHYLRNIQLQRAYEKNDHTAMHVIKRSIDLQLWIMDKHQVKKFTFMVTCDHKLK